MKKYKRFTLTEISYHWIFALTFLPLAISGGLMLTQKVFSLTWFAKHQLIAFHKYTAMAFIALPVLIALAGDWRIHLTNLLQSVNWKKHDFLWLLKKSVWLKNAQSGKFNPGQKIHLLLSLFYYVAFITTGLTMWFYKGILGAWYLHISLFILSVIALSGHLLLCLVNYPALSGMITGKVPANYIERNHKLSIKESLISSHGWWKLVVIIALLIYGINSIYPLLFHRSVEKNFANWKYINEEIVMPGELLAGHARRSKNCYACHNLLGTISNQKCLKCHKKISKRIKTSKGYHGQFKDKCTTCHNDHKGHDFELRPLKQKEFNHQQALFSLSGAHKKVKCEECHRQKNKKSPTYIGISFGKCNNCHKTPHGRQFSASCTKCHNPNANGWHVPFIKFNHQKTSFPLKGMHKHLSCGECHKKNRYGRVQYTKMKYRRCNDCHEDVHRGIKQSCSSCHNEKGWHGKHLNFNHNTTRFPLNKDHQGVSCNKCHQQKNVFSKNTISCESCHSDYANIVAGKWGGKTFPPDRHYKKISCKGCHEDEIKRSTVSPEKTCSHCHTPHYEEIFFKRKFFINNTIRKFEALRKYRFSEYTQQIGGHNYLMLKYLLHDNGKSK
ncbi:cytochrome b/b6 domain-containing protein [Candidatus Uabimicrobium amorphum]|nr:cytochrome b/b6 domain-containing protein [Candidatus Uabimicrobium amorphum]